MSFFYSVILIGARSLGAGPQESRRISSPMTTLARSTPVTPPSRTPLADLNNLLLEFRAAGIPIHAQLTDQIEDFGCDFLLAAFVVSQGEFGDEVLGVI